MGPEIVQRLVGPRAVGKIGNECARQRHRLIGVPKAAERIQIEEPRFGLARRLLEIRADLVACHGKALEEAVAFREAQIDDLAIVAGHLALHWQGNVRAILNCHLVRDDARWLARMDRALAALG